MGLYINDEIKMKLAQLCLTLTLYDPMEYTVHGILQARIPEWVAFPFSKESSQPRDGTQSESEVAQSCPTLCDPVDCSLPGSSIHGILQARILEWVAISFSRGSSQPRDRTQVSHIAGRRFNL